MKNKGIGSIVIIILVAIAAFLGGIYFSRNRGGQTVGEATTPTSSPSESTPSPSQPSTIGRFTPINGELIKENGKPVIYYFGSTSCPHCRWESPIIEKVTKKFGQTISFHNNMDSQADQSVYTQYTSINGGAIPFIVIGGQYVRVGSGENPNDPQSETVEEKNLTALICKITNNQPASVCSSVKDLVDQIPQ